MTNEIKKIQAVMKQKELEVKELIKERTSVQIKIDNLNGSILQLNHKIRILKENYYFENLVVTDVHRNLIRRLNIEGSLDYKDIIIQIDQKRPFGNSFIENDIAEVMGIEKGDDGYTDDQTKQMDQIIEELPFALRIVLGQI